MHKEYNLEPWKDDLLDRIFHFGVKFGFITLLVSGSITLYSSLYIQTTIYVIAYLLALVGYYYKNLSNSKKVWFLIFITYLISITGFFLEASLTLGFLWVTFGIFFCITFFDLKKFIPLGFIYIITISFWFINYELNIIPAQRVLDEYFYYVKYINSSLFLIAGILYVNEKLIKSLAKSLAIQQSTQNELFEEKKKLEAANYDLSQKINEVNKLKEELLTANTALTDKVEVQEEGIKETLKDLQNEIVTRKETEDELLKTREELILSLEKEKALNEMKSKFIAMISHEYRTPLTVLMNSSYLVGRYFETNDKIKFEDSLHKINSAVENMTNLLEEVIRFGHSENIENKNVLQNVDLVHQINTIVENFQDKEDLKIDYSIDTPYSPFIINTDPRKLRLILNNVIKNAVTYSSGNPIIRVTLEESDKNVDISISDKGIGITQNDRDKVFEPFYRGENTIGNAGTGLGLAISKRYVESLDGTIDFDSQVDKGTNFTIILPTNITE
ncbi:MAG: ATP-binding protein [Chlorobiota bacterium]